jgi:hypothetical protein
MKVEIIVPTSLNEIPLKNYQDFMKVYNSGSDETFIAEKMVQIFCGLKLNEVINIRATDVFDIVGSLNTLFNSVPKFENRFTLGGIEFGFIPHFEEITSGEYIDLENYITDIATMHKAMAVMYRPILTKDKDKYTIREYTGADEFAEAMKYAPLGIVLATNVFFWTLRSDLLSALITYLKREVNKMSLTSDTNSINSGDGTQLYINSQMEMLQSLMKSQEQDYLNALPFLHTNHN